MHPFAVAVAGAGAVAVDVAVVVAVIVAAAFAVAFAAARAAQNDGNVNIGIGNECAEQCAQRIFVMPYRMWAKRRRRRRSTAAAGWGSRGHRASATRSPVVATIVAADAPASITA